MTVVEIILLAVLALIFCLLIFGTILVVSDLKGKR